MLWGSTLTEGEEVVPCPRVEEGEEPCPKEVEERPKGVAEAFLREEGVEGAGRL